MKTRVLLFVVLLLCPVFCESQNIFFNHLVSNLPNSNQTLNGLCQDSNGAIWIGTREGVRTYDGVRLKKMNPFDSRDDVKWAGEVNMLNASDPERVYMLSEGKLTYYDLTTEEFVTLSDLFFHSITWSQKSVYAASKHKIYRYDGKSVSLFYESPSLNEITYIWGSDAKNRLVIGFNNGELITIDYNGKVDQRITLEGSISVIYEDSKSDLWVGTRDHGLFLIQLNENKGICVLDPQKSLLKNHIRALLADDAGALWIGTMRGLYRYRNESFTYYGQSDNNVSGLNNLSIWSLMKDRQGTIWVGTYFGGIYYFNPQYENYTYHIINNPEINRQLLLGQIVKDKRGSFWIASEGNGLLCYDPKTKSHKWFTSTTDLNTISHNNIKGLLYDSTRDCLWLCMHEGGVTRFDCSTQRATRIKDPSFPKLSNEIVRGAIPWGDNIIFATQIGVYTLQPQTSRFSSLEGYPKGKRATALYLDGEELWVAADDRIVRVNLRTSQSKTFRLNLTSKNVTTSHLPSALFVDSKKQVWVGTEFYGLYILNPQTGESTSLNSSNSSLQGDDIYAIGESRSGYILVATGSGLSQIDIQNNKIYNHYRAQGFPLASMNPGGIYCESNGLIYCSGGNGLISISEDKLLPIPKKFNINFTHLSINNEPVVLNDKNGILKKSIFKTEQITLDHNQSNVQFKFSTDNYIKANPLLYEYQLSGLSDKWVSINPEENITFLNLSPGKYKLNLRAYNPNFPEYNSIRSITIRVTPPFYKSWYAFLFYLLIIGGIIIWYIRFAKAKLRLETTLLLERKEKEQIELSNQSKLRFFTNISHEFRTPITLIMGQLQMLLETSSLQPALYNRVLTIYRNASKMQNLISELLDFRKQEQGFLSLKVSQCNLVDFVHEIFISFQEYARFKGINFQFESQEEKIFVWIDETQFQKAIINIVSNAFKYTLKDGKIKILLEKGSNSVFIRVQDTGIGIAPDVLQKIFDRFYQVENLSGGANVEPATGIGLALAKGIVELHGGNINVRSEENVGSVFTIEVKIGADHFENNPLITKVETPNPDAKTIQTILNETPIEYKQKTPESASQAEELILVVEDNEELCQLLSSLFNRFYRVETASNGEEGLNKARELQPDLIISDVMMPLMSGTEMCSILKSEPPTSHIPIILLTALSTIEQKIEGFKTGVDDYITKPFNTSLLLTRCRNILHNRRVMREKYCHEYNAKTTSIATSNLDQQFIDEAIAVIENHLEDSTFDVKQFAHQMRYGLTNFYSKIKGITGQTPNEFIMMVKLKKAAATFVENPDLQIAEVCYRMGFSTPKYFSICFKKQFGITPSEFKMNLGKNSALIDINDNHK